jgi:hypothetical protein
MIIQSQLDKDAGGVIMHASACREKARLIGGLLCC